MSQPKQESVPRKPRLTRKWWAGVAVAVLIILVSGLALWWAPAEAQERVGEMFEALPENLGGHMALSLASLAVGIVISLALGIYASTKDSLAAWVVGVAGILQTIPSLALLALMVPLLGGRIGFRPAFVAMTLYSLLPILENTITGLRKVDKLLIEAGEGLGMDRLSVFTQIKWPLALPSIISGIRLAAVLVVGSATLATPVGSRTLGNYIFIGLNTRDYLQVVFGCVAAALLAVIFTQLIGLIEMGLKEGDRKRRKRLLTWAAGGLLLLVVGGLYHPLARLLNPPDDEITLGTHDYTEQHVLGEMLREVLREKGINVRWRQSMGQPMTLQAMFDGKIDVCVEYLGNIWTNVMKKPPGATQEVMLKGVSDYLEKEHDVEVFGPLGFQNAYAFAMRDDEARARHITTVEDLKSHARNLTIGGDMQFFKQAEWKECKKKYELRFYEELSMDPTLTYGAVQLGKKVQVIVAYSTDARIKAYNLRILEDNKQGLPRYDAVILLSKNARDNAALRKALKPLLGSIDDDHMLNHNKRVDVDEVSPRKAAHELIADLRKRGKLPARASQ